jgi:hypothetical protein
VCRGIPLVRGTARLQQVLAAATAVRHADVAEIAKFTAGSNSFTDSGGAGHNAINKARSPIVAMVFEYMAFT